MYNKLLIIATVAALNAAPAFAGNIVLTGHDNDFHRSTQSLAAMDAALEFVRNGSTLPVLTFDAGTQLTSALTALGISSFNVNPTIGSLVTDALFDTATYSAFAVASAATCGGCDNPQSAFDNLAMHSTAIADFFNDGGGIYGLAGATYSNAYGYIPTAATNAGGSPPSAGFVQTSDGAALGIPAVNGDPTHNFFNEPGVGGLSSAFVVTERLSDAVTGGPITVAVLDGTIDDGGIIGGGDGGVTDVPEPGTWSVFLFGLFGIGLALSCRQYRR